jgi:ACS family sodium-dependent inorganic phosphate cotransporter
MPSGGSSYQRAGTSSASSIDFGSINSGEDAMVKAQQFRLSKKVAKENGDDADDISLMSLQPAGGEVRSGQACYVPRRMVMALLCFAMEVVCYCDRTNISLAIVPMQKAYGYSDSVDGLVLAAFFVGYACTQIIGGVLAQQYGAKPVLGFAVFMWSLWTLLTPAAASVSLPVLFICRMLMGFGEGVSLPCVHNITSQWVPANERSRFLTLCTSGQFIGTMVAMSCAPLVDKWWPSVFYLFGCLGLCWNLCWHCLASSTPQSHPAISTDELRYIQMNQEQLPESKRSTPWRSFFRESAFLAIMVAHFVHNWGW